MDKQNICGGIKWAKVIENPKRERSGVEHMAKEDRKAKARIRSNDEMPIIFYNTNNCNSFFSVFKLIL